MNKKFTLFVLIIFVIILSTACTQSSDDSEKLEEEMSSMQEENDSLKAENEDLKKENSELKKELNSLENKISEEEKKEIIQEEDVEVELTEKYIFEGDYSDYVGFVFTVTNNTEKSIKGVQGIATFKDIFGVEIIKIGVDFTGSTIESNQTSTIDDLSLDINQFMDDHMKLYNTAYDDLEFEYEVTSIVFTDGTSKQSN